MKVILNIVVPIFLVYTASAQYAETMLDKNHIYIGQQVVLTYHVTVDKNTRIQFTPLNSKIPIRKVNTNSGKDENSESEILEPFSDTLIKKNNQSEWFGSYVLTIWDSGHFIIPSTIILIEGKKVTLPLGHIMVDLVPEKKGQDIFDIKESFTEIPNEPVFEKIKRFHRNNWQWIYSILGMILLYFLYKSYRKTDPVIEQKNETLEELILREINELENKRLWTDNKLKEHYVELSFILRSYLSKRFDINLLEKTSFESKVLLIQKGLPKKAVDNIGEILDQADMVKFAKSTTEEITVIRLSTLAKQIVNETSPKEIKDV